MCSLIVIDDFYINGMAVFETETQSPLVVDADAPLSGPVSGKEFKAVGKRFPQILRRGCDMQSTARRTMSWGNRRVAPVTNKRSVPLSAKLLITWLLL